MCGFYDCALGVHLGATGVRLCVSNACYDRGSPLSFRGSSLEELHSPPSPRSAPSSKLSPLYVPVSPVSRAERCKPWLGAIFQAFPALCSCEPRLTRGEVQAVPCGARSNTRLLPASTSQPSPAGIRSVRKYNAGICLFVQVKTVLTFGHVSYPAREINRPLFFWRNEVATRWPDPCLKVPTISVSRTRLPFR